MIHWETALHEFARNAQIADVPCIQLPRTIRLYVKRAGKGSRAFIAYCDGRYVRGAWDTMDAAKVAVIKHAREQGLIA